ncbi:uncharacterized protein LOC9637432 isoform X2 [Selaginella moellendorffii]|uniref:uncharacterized protein LOC9637432 isoform X2 n=1 Tax=Selaginella moellendorffii TaxID=88036 RepID=UPI000D1CF1E9|nr:uncharacterized protein LOC9637432 isoform X2 [Selaginella moellendorffii]|eukprot:XP_024533359.1 uncharacterized protein LOC9637432 isoform X2 [Selaginella moellendorffii]
MKLLLELVLDLRSLDAHYLKAPTELLDLPLQRLVLQVHVPLGVQHGHLLHQRLVELREIRRLMGGAQESAARTTYLTRCILRRHRNFPVGEPLCQSSWLSSRVLTTEMSALRERQASEQSEEPDRMEESLERLRELKGKRGLIEETRQPQSEQGEESERKNGVFLEENSRGAMPCPPVQLNSTSLPRGVDVEMTLLATSA